MNNHQDLEFTSINQDTRLDKSCLVELRQEVRHIKISEVYCVTINTLLTFSPDLTHIKIQCNHCLTTLLFVLTLSINKCAHKRETLSYKGFFFQPPSPTAEWLHYFPKLSHLPAHKEFHYCLIYFPSTNTLIFNTISTIMYKRVFKIE